MKYFFWIPQVLLFIATFCGLIIPLDRTGDIVRGWEGISIVLIGIAEILLFLYYISGVREGSGPILAMFSLIGALTFGVFAAIIHAFYIPLANDVVKETLMWFGGVTVASIPFWVCAIGLVHYVFDLDILYSD